VTQRARMSPTVYHLRRYAYAAVLVHIVTQEE
jgi:hypothetical protein